MTQSSIAQLLFLWTAYCNTTIATAIQSLQIENHIINQHSFFWKYFGQAGVFNQMSEERILFCLHTIGTITSIGRYAAVHMLVTCWSHDMLMAACTACPASASVNRKAVLSRISTASRYFLVASCFADARIFPLMNISSLSSINPLCINFMCSPHGVPSALFHA